MKTTIKKLKQHKHITVYNQFNEIVNIKINSVYYKLDNITGRCNLCYDGYWKYNNETPYKCYGATFMNLRHFCNSNIVLDIQYNN